MGSAGRAREGVSAPCPHPSRRQHGEPETARPDLRPPRRGDKSISGATRPPPARPRKPRRHRPTSPPPPLHPAPPPWGPGGAVVTPQPLSPKKQRARGPRRYHPVTPILVWGDGHYSDLGPGNDGVSTGPGESLRQQPSVLSRTPPRRQFGSGRAPGSPWLPLAPRSFPGTWTLAVPARQRGSQKSPALGSRGSSPPVAQASLFSSQDWPQL